MLIVPERGPSIPDARGWAISVLQQVGASREHTRSFDMDVLILSPVDPIS